MLIPTHNCAHIQSKCLNYISILNTAHKAPNEYRFGILIFSGRIKLCYSSVEISLQLSL